MELAGRASDGIDRLPMAHQPGLAEKAPWWPDWMAHPDRDEYWTSMAASEHTENMATPALHIGGWFDIYVNNTVNTYRAVRERAATAEAREGQRLIIGPWDHMDATGVYPHRDLGPDASSDAAGVVDAHMRFYDRHLRGNESALDGEAPVRIFVMGVNRWRDEAEWPLTDTRYTDFFLDGAGALTRTSPTVDVVEEYVYDPMNPAPTKGGRMLDLAATLGCGPVDQAEVAQRDDVLVFTSPVLAEPLEVTGHVSAVLHVSSSALDTDFTGKLVDIDPDGRAIYLTDGILRMRYRDSFEKPQLITPDDVYEITVDMSVTSNVFLPGHRIGLEVSSSNFPRFVRNTNTGGRIVDDVEVVVATNRILHGPTHPSRLVLPIIDRR
jgi:putative CocE/NonD family hydrolase